MKSEYAATRPPCLSLLLASLATAGLLPLGARSLSAQTSDTWNGGTGNWSDNTFWSTGNVPNGGAYDVYVDGDDEGVASVVSVNGNYTVGRLTVDSGDTVNVANGANLTVSSGAFDGSGSLVNNGTINVNDTGSGASLQLGGPASLSGINLSGANARLFENHAGDRLTLPGYNSTISGQGNLGGGSTTFTNNGFVIANVSGGTLTVHPGGGTADFTNNNNLFATTGGTLQFSNASGGTLTNNGLVAAGAGGSTVNVPAGALTNLSGTTLTGGSFFVAAAGANPSTLSLGGGQIVTDAALVELDGARSVFNEINAVATIAPGGVLSFINGRNFTTAGALTNAGSLNVNLTSYIAPDLDNPTPETLTVSGDFHNAAYGQAYLGSGTLAVQGGLTNAGQIQIGGGTLSVQGNATNSGLIDNSVGENLVGGVFTVQGTLTSSGGLYTGYNGHPSSNTVSGAFTLTSTGALLGSGSLTAPTLSLAGSLRPGDDEQQYYGFTSGVGTLTLNGQVGLTGSTVLLFDLAGTAASDEIKVNGALTLAGTLDVNALKGFGACRYDLIDYTGTLTNDGLVLGTLPAGYDYAIDTSIAGQVDLVVTSDVPEPSTWAAALLGLGLLTLLRRRSRA